MPKIGDMPSLEFKLWNLQNLESEKRRKFTFVCVIFSVNIIRTDEAMWRWCSRLFLGRNEDVVYLSKLIRTNSAMCQVPRDYRLPKFSKCRSCWFQTASCHLHSLKPLKPHALKPSETIGHVYRSGRSLSANAPLMAGTVIHLNGRLLTVFELVAKRSRRPGPGRRMRSLRQRE